MTDSAEVNHLRSAVLAEAQRSPAPALSPALEAALARLGSLLWGEELRPYLSVDELARRELGRLFCIVLPPYYVPTTTLAGHPAAAASFARGLLFVASNSNFEPAAQRAAHALLDKLAAQVDAAVTAGPSGWVPLPY
jgi:hypothetical protein